MLSGNPDNLNYIWHPDRFAIFPTTLMFFRLEESTDEPLNSYTQALSKFPCLIWARKGIRSLYVQGIMRIYIIIFVSPN